MYCHRRFDIGDLEHPALKRKLFHNYRKPNDQKSHMFEFS